LMESLRDLVVPSLAGRPLGLWEYRQLLAILMALRLLETA
jgi:hypothetical protein